MRTTKSYKIVSLLIAMALSLIAFSLCLGVEKKAFAASAPNASSYFTSTSVLEFKEDGVGAMFEEEGEISTKHELALDNLGFELKPSADIEELSVTVYTAPYLVAGNVRLNDENEKELVETVEHKLSIAISGSSLTIKFNGETATATLSGNLNVGFKVASKVLYAVVEGTEVFSSKAEYKVYDLDTCIAEEVVFQVVKLASNVTEAELLILSVDQNTADATGKYKQTFKLDADGKLEKQATPYGVIDNSFISPNGQINLRSLYKHTLTLRGLSVLGELKTANLRLTKFDANDDDIWFENVENPKAVVFKEAGVEKINIETNLSAYEDKVLRTIEINVFEEDTFAPIYNDALVGSEMYEAYQFAVKEATKVNEDGKESYISLGEDYKVPSLENFVSDNLSSYANLDATVYYQTPTEEDGSSNDFTIPIDTAGDYFFYVVFEDDDGNAMEKDDFFTIDEDEENEMVKGKYGAFVFYFHIEDDSAFSVEANKALGKGFVGELYSATEFKIDASDFTKTYRLFYNSNKEAKAEDDGWVEIIASKNLKDDYQNPLFTADDIKEIDYNGVLSFTPDREGAYKFICTIVSDTSTRADEAEAVFKVEKPVVVKNYEPLETREILAIVFLSVGGVCLIGIIALIFVKPKEEKVDAE